MDAHVNRPETSRRGLYEIAPSARRPDDGGAVDIAYLIGIVRRRRWLIGAVTAAGLALSLAFALFVLPSYTAKALIVVDDATGEVQRPEGSIIDTQIAKLTSHAHLQRVSEAIAADPKLHGVSPLVSNIEKRLKVTQELRSQLLGVTYTASNPQAASEVANLVVNLYLGNASADDPRDWGAAAAQRQAAVSALEARLADAQSRETAARRANDAARTGALEQEASELARELDAARLSYALSARQEAKALQKHEMAPPARLYAAAQPPDRPSSPSPILIVAPATIAAAVFAIALAYALAAADSRIRSTGDFEHAFGRAAAGRIPVDRNGSKPAMDALVARTLLLPQDSPKVIVVTPATAHVEAERFGLAFATAAARLRPTLLIDLTDSRVGPGAGPSKLGEREIDAILHAHRAADHAAPQAGALDRPLDHWRPRDCLAVASSESFRRSLARFCKLYDWVIVDCGAAPRAAHALTLAASADLVLAVAPLDIATFEEVGATLDTFGAVARQSRNGFALEVALLETAGPGQ